jgi:hypothetical protein
VRRCSTGGDGDLLGTFAGSLSVLQGKISDRVHELRMPINRNNMLMAVIRHSDHDASIFGSPSSTRTYNPLVNSEASGFLGSGSELEGKGRIPLSNFVSSPGVVAVEDPYIAMPASQEAHALGNVAINSIGDPNTAAEGSPRSLASSDPDPERSTSL